METMVERVVDLESILARFMTTTQASAQRQDRMCERLDQTCQRLDQNIQRLDQNIQRLDQMCQRLDRSYEELKADSRKHTLEMAHIADRIGRFAEDIVAPNIPRIAEEAFGITDIELEAPRIKRRHSQNRGRLREFDIVLAGNRHLLVTSVKSTARERDVTEFVEALKEVFDYFPEFRGYTLVPILASMALSADQVRRLTRLKIYAMALGQRTMELLNLEQVRARRPNQK